MRYYLVSDVGTQWFHYLISKTDTEVVEVHDMHPLHAIKSTLLSNIYAREPISKWLELRHGRLALGGGDFGGWTISELEFNRIKRLLELAPAVDEFHKLANSV